MEQIKEKCRTERGKEGKRKPTRICPSVPWALVAKHAASSLEKK
jgi:hypothetical protein